MNHPKWLGSSANADKLSRTAKSLPTLIMFAAVWLKVDIPETEVDTWVQTIFVAVNGVITAYYASVRVYNKYLKPWWQNRK